MEERLLKNNKKRKEKRSEQEKKNEEKQQSRLKMHLCVLIYQKIIFFIFVHI